MPANTSNKQKENKPARIPVSGVRDILAVYGKNPDYEYRFVKETNDGGMRIHNFKRGGWTFTDGGDHSDITVGAECVYDSKRGNGTIVRYPAGHGEWLYLMQIQKELYAEDKAAREARVDETEAAITGKSSSDDNELGQYGEVKIGRD